MEESFDNIKNPQQASHKASLLLRVIAKTIDFIIIATAIKLVPQVGYLAGVVYFLISDGLFEGRSIGKKVMRLRVISLKDDGSASFRESIIRNSTITLGLLLFKIPLFGWLLAPIIFIFEFLLILGNKDGMRLGDDLANTKVIEG